MVLNRWRIIEATLLVAIIGLAFYMALLPRLDYPFPLHIDEWIHLGALQHLLDTGRSGGASVYAVDSTTQGNIEAGYQIWLAQLFMSTGMSWRILNRVVPALVLALIAFGAYVFGRKHGIGLPAAFFVTFIPTTIRFLGPAFMVPVALGLVFFPLSLLILDKFRTDWKYLILLILVMLSLFVIHGTTAVALGIVLVVAVICCLLISPPEGRLRRTWLASLLLIPVTAVMLLIWNPQAYLSIIRAEFTMQNRVPLPAMFGIIPKFGYVPTLFFAAAIVALFLKADWRRYAVVISATGFVLFQIYYSKSLPFAPDILYERAWLYATLLISLAAGFGVADVYIAVSHWVRRNGVRVAVVFGMASFLLVASLIPRIDSYKKEPYYHVIGVGDYYDFLFVRECLDDQSRAILDPYVAWAFPPVSGKPVYAAAASPWGAADFQRIMKFFSDGATDTDWLRQNKVDILITGKTLQNPDLVQVKQGVYLLREDKAWPKSPSVSKLRSDLDLLRHPVSLARKIFAYFFG